MTDEQIKLNAEVYANTLLIGGLGDSPKLIALVSFEEGAHSRDAEIENLQNQIEELLEQLKMNAENIQKLRNPWISVKDQLPEMFVDSKGITHDFSVKVLVINENNPNYWRVAEYYPDKNDWCCLEHPTYIIDNVTHWMPIPKV